MTKKFNRKRSLDEGEIVLEEVSLDEAVSTDVEVIVPIEQEPAYVMEVEVSANTEPTPDLASSGQPTTAEIKFAKQFTGIPATVHYSGLELAHACTSKKLLAEFEVGLFARGSQWHIYCK